MDIKREQPAGPARARRSVLSKLGRAVHFSTVLARLCEPVADESTVYEAKAYAKSMEAALALEKEEWQSALRSYQLVHKIYTLMAGIRSGTSSATIFEKRLEEIAQAIRFCKYNLSREGDDLEDIRADGVSDVLADKIEKALIDARKRAAVSFGSVTWCGRNVMLRAERVREAVHMALEEGKRFEKDAADTPVGVDDYDKLFMVFNDALNVVNRELAEFKSSSGADDRVKELEYLVAYIMYQRLQYTVLRNLLLIQTFNKKRSKPDDFVRLYDNLVTNMTDVLSLPGVEEDAAIANDTEARRKLFQAHRCFHLAQCYQAVQLESQAAALFDRVNVHAASLSGEYAKEAKQLVDKSIGMKCRARAQAFLNENDVTIGIDQLGIHDRSTMIEHLDSFESFAPDDSVKVICEMPPALEAVPCKPVFFDLAIDGVRFPQSVEEEKVEEKVVEKQEENEDAATSTFAATRFGRWWSGTS